jgi:transposase
MKYVSIATEADHAALEQMHLNGKTARQRQRAHAVLLSAQGYKLDQLADILRADRDTVSGWLDAWQEQGLDGLVDAPKYGRTPKIDAAIKTYLHEMLENPSPNIKALVLDELKKKKSE